MSSNRGLIIVLIVSLCVNLALVGFLLGRASPMDFRGDAINPMWGVARILRDLPETRRAELRSHFRTHQRALRPDLRSIRQAQSDLGAALLADPFDPDALNSALDSFRNHLHASQITSHSAFVTLIESLTPEERALLVESMQWPGNARRREPNRRRPSR